MFFFSAHTVGLYYVAFMMLVTTFDTKPEHVMDVLISNNLSMLPVCSIEIKYMK